MTAIGKEPMTTHPPELQVATPAPPCRPFAWAPLLAMILLFICPAGVFAKGGEEIAPFPSSAALTGRQEAKAMTVDSAGNVIVVGATNNGGVNNDYHLAKFKADGSGLAWQTVSYDRVGGDDTATAVVVDGNGDILVTGYSWNGANYDLQTIKYAGGSGALIWQQTYAGAAGGSDYATAIAVDTDNNVYVAGYAFNSAGNDDFLIIKHAASNGAPLWTKIHDDPIYQNNDRVTAIAVGSDGMAVTGYSAKNGADFDILTHKYSLSGTLIREWRKSSAGSGDDRGVAVKLDAAGNPIVTGTLTNSTHTDIYTAKCSLAADNATSWEKIYDGGFDDKPAALAVTAAGDVYVTGDTFTLNGHEDFYTVRYQGSSGSKVWDSIYHSGSENDDIPVGIVVSEKPVGDNGVFVVGYSTTAVNDNITTLKYLQSPPTSQGVLLWQSSHNGPANKNDRPVGIGLASVAVASDPLVGGWSDTVATSLDFLALRYDYGPLNAPNGLVATATANTAIELNWQDTATNEDGFKIERKLGANGTFSQIGTTAENITTYADSGLTPNSYYYYRVRANNSANGDSTASNEAHALTKVVSYDAPAWSYIYNGPDNREDRATGITVDADGHPVVTGYSELAEEGVAGTYSFDYLTKKLDRGDKGIKWQARYDSGGDADMAAGVALDNSGNAIVTGTAYLMNGGIKSDDLYTRKVATAGLNNPAAVPALVWEHQYGTNSGIDLATAVKVVRNGSNQSVVIGHGMNGANNYDMFLIKYNASGTTAWPPAVYNSGRDDLPTDVAFDAAGNIFLAGYSKNVSGDVWYVAKYDGATGSRLWDKSYAGQGIGDNQPRSAAVDAAGNLYVTGFGTNSAGDEEMVTIKYTGTTGAPIWQVVHNGMTTTPGGDDRGISIAIDPIDGAIVVGGTSYRTVTDSDFHLRRYNAADGTIIWERNFDRPVSYDYVSAMAVDSSGYIYVTGTTRSGPDTDFSYDATADIMALIYDFEGTFLGATTYNGNGREKAATAISANYQGESFIAGFSRNASNPDYLVLKLTNPYLLVPAPLAVSSPADASKLVLTWQENTPGTNFKIERTFGPVLPTSVWTQVTTPASGTTSYTNSGLTAGTNYCYRISAYTGSLVSRPVENCATTTLAPTTLAAPTVASTSQISLSWNLVANSTGYKLERKIAAGSWSDLGTVGDTIYTYSDSGLTPGTTYSYRVSSNSSAGYSLPSNEQSAITRPVAPSLAAPASISNAQMTLGWNTVTGAASYTLQAKPGSGSYADVGSCIAIVGTSCAATGLTPNTTYTFRVKATNSSGDSTWSNETSAAAILAVPTWASNTPSNVTDTSMTLTWVNPPVSGSGTVTYTLQFSLASGSYADETTASACAGTTALTCNLSGLVTNTPYFFRIKASNAAGNSVWSSETSRRMMLATPTLISANRVSTTQIDLNWSAVTGAQRYGIERSDCTVSDTGPAGCDGTNNYGQWNQIRFDVVGTNYSVTGLVAGNNYRFRVFADSVTPSNGSDFSTSLHAWTNLPAPPNLAISPASSTALILSWDQKPGETSYTIETGPTATGAWTEIVAAQPMNSVSYTHSSLTTGTAYCYRIKAVSTVTAPPPAIYSTAVCKTTPPVEPTLNPLTVASASQINLAWSTVASATDYEVERCPTSDHQDPVNHPFDDLDLSTCTYLTPLVAAGTTTLNNSGLTAGATYRYRVRAKYTPTDYTAWSNALWATTTPPAPTLSAPAAGTATTSQLTPSWSNVTGDNGYKLYWKAGSCTDDSWIGPLAQAINTTSYNHSGLTAGTWYCYKVSAIGPSGTPDSTFSGIVSQTTKTVAPTLNALSSITANSISLSWNTVTGNTGYQIDRSPDNATWSNNVATVATGATTYSDSGRTPGTRYYYRVSANSGSGLSAVSNAQSATTIPAATTTTATVVSATEIALAWPVTIGTTNYKVSRKTGTGSYGEITNQAVAYTQKYCNQDYPTVACPALSAITATYTDTGRSGNTTYCYQVRTANGSGDSAPSSEECVTTPAEVATQTVTATALNSFRIRIDWSPLVCGSCAAITGYQLERLVREGVWRQITTTNGSTFSYSDALAIDPGRRLRYRVRAISGSDISAYSETSVVPPAYTAGATNCPP